MQLDDFEIKRIVATEYNSNCYILWNRNTAHALIVDPNEINQIKKIINTYHLQIDYIFATHEHYDHIAALSDTKIFTSGKIIVSDQCCKELPNVQKKLKRTYQLHMYFAKGDRKKTIPIYRFADADKSFSKDMTILWEGKKILLKITPGHSEGGISIVFDNKLVFSGDSILPDKPIITKILGGNWEKYKFITLKWYKNLSSELLVLPGHGETFQLGEKLSIYETYI